MLLSTGSICCLIFFVCHSSANPIFNQTNDLSTSDSPSDIICPQNSFSNQNTSLYEIFSQDRIWSIFARTTFVFGSETWKNGFVQTSIDANGTVEFEMIGENSNGTCSSSGKGRLIRISQSDDVQVQWPEKEGYLRMVYNDDNNVHLFVCYETNFNQTETCPYNQTEYLALRYNQEDVNNTTNTSVESYCSSISTNDFVFSDGSNKCVQSVSKSNGNESNVSETSAEDTLDVTTSELTNDSEETTAELSNIKSSLITVENQTEVIEAPENFDNGTTEQNDQTAVVSSVDMNNATEVSEMISTVVIPVVNETSVDETDRAMIHSNVTTFDETTEMIDTLSLETTESSVQVLETTKTLPIEVSTEMDLTTVELTATTTTITTTTTTSTVLIPVDCPVLKDCPFESCNFGRKYDHRGCPTCNCLRSNDQTNSTCPTLTCQPCLYGHHTDQNGCPTCQCQTRPYPPLGERCPQLNCDPCYFGTVKDEYNCESCICIRPNIQECPLLNCMFGSCKYGSVPDEDNCPSCECLLPKTNSSDVNCTVPSNCPPCHLGYIKDADGCQTCQCKLRGSGVCPSLASVCQCPYGSYLDNDGCETCSCLPDPSTAPRRACWQLSQEEQQEDQTSRSTCSPDGLFSPRQCSTDESKCWCVTPAGIVISGFESTPEENANCGCAVELYQVSSFKMIGHHLSCLSNGNYAPIQCDGRYCSCVDEDGKPIGPSVSIQNRQQLRCVGVYQQLHPERFLLHRGSVEHPDFSQYPHDISSSLCLTHLEQVRNANITDEHILIPVCDANGLYASVQCDQNEHYCWCVEKKTGVELEGTRRLNARPDCLSV